MRPGNILLDAADTIKLGDFDATVKTGEELLVTAPPFCKLNEDYEAPLAGAISEQYALGSCIYTIRTGHEPFHDVDGPVMVRKLMNNDIPPTSNDKVFGDTILRCWRGYYPSIFKLEQAISKPCGGFYEKQKDRLGTSVTQDCLKDTDLNERILVAECEAFLRQQRSRHAPSELSEVFRHA